MRDGVSVTRLLHYVPNPPRGIRRLVSEVSLGLRYLLHPIERDRVIVAISPALIATAIAMIRYKCSRSQPKFIVWVQDIYTLGMSETKEGGGFSTRVMKAVERFVVRSADRLVVIHPRFAEYLTENMGVETDNVTVIRNWTHLEPAPEIPRQAARDCLGWPSAVATAVHTGNMGAKQGLENIVESARLADARQEPVRFVLVGDGGERTKLQELARGIKRIEFVEPLNDIDYRRALASADCLIVNELPGVSSMAVPSKLTSYFDAGRPIIAATDAHGITASEILRSGAGVVVPAGDPAALLTAVIEMSGDPSRSASLGAAGQKYRKEALGADFAITEFERLIEDVVGG